MATAAPLPDPVAKLERVLAVPADPDPEGFTEAELEGLPEPVARWFRWAVAPGTPLARAARLEMRGHIKLGRWLPFRATEVLAPHVGFVWPASVLGVLRGSDRYADGEGVLDWRLLGRRPLAHAEGPDVSRSAANRGAAEGVWVPTALLPRFGATWEALDDSHLVVRLAMDVHPVEHHLHVDPATGRLLRFHLARWGDPDGSGTWRELTFGGDVTGWATFDGVTVASAGRAGWHHGTPAFAEGEFFRYEITRLELVR